jgi:eukaryotic-like serine/threonine-protein kinase
MAGEYRLLRKLGEGGFGAVYEAEHPLLKRRAAVKVLHRVADKDSDAVLRFISEAQAVNQIRNRHIIDVFSFGKLNDGRHYYIMDLLDGLPLDRFLKQHGKMDVASALQLLTPIAEALDLAHAAGIVHRDLKPQNIFLAWDGSGETIPKLLDFGMAKLLGESPVHTVSGTPIGTPLYMSPEQARGERVDHRSDVYALGVLCHELITGHLPFTGDTTVAVLMAHIIQTPPAASEVESSLSPLLDAPLLRMLEKDPNKRPGSAGEAVKALCHAAEQAGITLNQGPLRLPRPDPTISGERPHEGLDAGLEDFATTEPDAHAAASDSTGARTPLWPFAVGLVAAGAALGFAVLRASCSQRPAERGRAREGAGVGAAACAGSS